MSENTADSIPPVPAPAPWIVRRREAAARSAVLNAWRRVDLSAQEKALAPSTQSMETVMPKVLSYLKLDRRRSDAEVFKVWNHLLDPLIVAHAQPTGLRRGTLFVTVDSSAWLNEIVRYRRHEILERLQSSFGPDLVQKISFRIG